MDETVFLAHIAEDGREQTVDEHERGTAELCVPESLRPARRAEKARALR